MKPVSDSKRYISADGVAIRYWTTWQKGMNNPFYILHPGASMNHSSLERIEQELNNRGYPTITFDPRGSGASDHPIPREYFKLERLSSDLEGILTTEGIEKPKFLTHSFGFMPVLDYAARTNNAEHITGVCASHNFVETSPNKFLFHLFDKVLMYHEYLASIGTLLAHKIQGTERTYCDQSDKKSEFDLWLSIIDIPLRAAASHVIGHTEVRTNWNITEQLQKNTTPLTLIYASKDVMVLPIAGEYIKQKTTAPCKIHTVEGVPHSLPMRFPEKILDLINNN